MFGLGLGVGVSRKKHQPSICETLGLNPSTENKYSFLAYGLYFCSWGSVMTEGEHSGAKLMSLRC